MDNPKLRLCNHYATSDIDKNIPTVYLNCDKDKVKGYVDLLVNHELLHIQISKEGYPVLVPDLVYGNINNNNHKVNEIACLVRSVIEHPIIQQRQIEMGISDKEFQDMLARNVEKDLCCNDFAWPEKLKNALHYVDRILLCKNIELKKSLDEKYDEIVPNSKSLGKYLLLTYCKLGGSIGGKNNTKKILAEWGKILEQPDIKWKVKNPNHVP